MKKRTKNISMAILAGATALVTGQSAHAALEITSVVTPNQTFSNGTYDVVDFFLTGLTGVDLTNGTLGAGVLGLSGTFTATGTSATLGVPGGDTVNKAQWTNFITNTGVPPAGYAASFVNLDSQTTPSRSGTGTGTVSGSGSHPATAITGNSTSFGSTWFTTSSDIQPSPTTDFSANNQVAEILVSPGGGVSFSGAYITYGTNGGVETFSYSPTVASTKVVSLTAAGGSAGGTTALTGTFNPSSPTAGVINVVGASPAGYVKGELNNITNGVTGQTQIKFENAGGTGNDPGTEVIALNLAESAGGNLSTDEAQLISDINDSTKGIGPGTASVLTNASPYWNVFNTGRSDPYDVLLTVPTTMAGAFSGGSSFLGFDLTQDSSLSHLSIVDVAAVPEPASATVIMLGAAGLLLGRRKRKIEIV